jgi:hypothetical protein
VLPDAGVSVRDAVSGEQFFIMDVGLSQYELNSSLLLATRTIPLGGYWMMGGAALPMVAEQKDLVLDVLKHERLLVDGVITEPHDATLLIVRACLESGAAENISYDDQSLPPKLRNSSYCRPRRVQRAPSRNAPCSCGSGKKYKGCCGKR